MDIKELNNTYTVESSYIALVALLRNEDERVGKQFFYLSMSEKEIKEFEDKVANTSTYDYLLGIK